VNSRVSSSVIEFSHSTRRELVGLTEIAELLEVCPQRVDRFAAGDDF
jgi:hypothetical protein